MLTRKEAIRLIDPYVAGDLNGEQLSSFETLMREDEVIAAEVKLARRIESSMFSQPWLSPSSEFTRAILARIGLQPAFVPTEEPVSKRELLLEWMHGLAPAAVIIGFVIMFGRALLDKLVLSLEWTASVFDGMTGTHIFSAYPSILVGAAILPIGALIISATVTRRLRLAS